MSGRNLETVANDGTNVVQYAVVNAQWFIDDLIENGSYTMILEENGVRDSKLFPSMAILKY